MFFYPSLPFLTLISIRACSRFLPGKRELFCNAAVCLGSKALGVPKASRDNSDIPEATTSWKSAFELSCDCVDFVVSAISRTDVDDVYENMSDQMNLFFGEALNPVMQLFAERVESCQKV